MPAEFAACQSGTRIPAAATASRIFRNAPICPRVNSAPSLPRGPASSAEGKCVIAPTSLRPRRPASSQITSSARSSGKPNRPMPVSSFTWTPTGGPRRRRETSSSRRAKSRSLSAASNPCSTISGASSGSSAPRTRISPAIPAARSAAPSSTSATPNRFTPSAASVRLTAAAPWPYASALTMPMISTAGPTSARIARRLSRTAERSISAIVGRGIRFQWKNSAVLLFVIVILIG